MYVLNLCKYIQLIELAINDSKLKLIVKGLAFTRVIAKMHLFGTLSWDDDVWLLHHQPLKFTGYVFIVIDVEVVEVVVVILALVDQLNLNLNWTRVTDQQSLHTF